MTRHTIRAEGRVGEILNEAENKSDLVREAVEAYAGDETADETDTEGLTDLQRRGLSTLREMAYAGDAGDYLTISKEIAESRLAQSEQIDRGEVVRHIIKPLMDSGYIYAGFSVLTVYETPRDTSGDSSDEWTPVETHADERECEPKHWLLPAGATCPTCGVETDGDSDETETDSDGIDMDATVTKCDCGRPLAGRTSVCLDCRTETEGQT